MNTFPNWTRAGLAYLAIAFVLVGIWAQCWPISFYNNFPGIQLGWVRADGPFNEHLIRDVGGLNLGLGLACMFAWFVPQARVVQMVSLIALVYGVPHFIYHFEHMDVLNTRLERIANTVLLGLNAVIPLFLLIGLSKGQSSKQTTKKEGKKARG